MQGNVKRGDSLRTLCGATTAQWKVLHLLFSQSDYLNITMHHIIQSLTVGYFISLLSHRGFIVDYLREERIKFSGMTL